MTLETRSRSLAKALSWRLSGSVATTLIVWLFTRRLELAVGVGAIEILGKMVLYFVHERIWARIPMGREALPARTVLVKGPAGPERSRMVATIQSTLQRHGLAACQVGESLCSRSGLAGVNESRESRSGSSRSGISRLRTACNESGLCLIGESDCSEAGCPDCSFTPENTCLIVELPEASAAVSAEPASEETSGGRSDRSLPSAASPRTVFLNGKSIGLESVGREVLQAIKTGVR